MTEIKRYELVHLGGGEHFLMPAEDGDWIKYEDHAAVVAELNEKLSRYTMSPGQYDQRRSESDAVRVALGFAADADDVSPSDLLEKITALNEKAQALAAENAAMLRLLADISSNHVEYYSDGECGMFAGVPLDYVSEINMYVGRDVNAENQFQATDAAIRDIRAQGVESYANELRINGIAAKENGHDITADFLSKESSRAAVYAARIRKGEQE